MKQNGKNENSPGTPAKQLAGFLAKYYDGISKLAGNARLKLRKQMPTAVELVYDNYNALAIGFGPSDRASEVIVSLALYPRWVSLFLMQGAKLSDPEKLLRGSGKQVRHIVLGHSNDLDKAAVRALLAEAIRSARTPLPPVGRGHTVIKFVSAKQRPRPPGSGGSATKRMRKPPNL